MASKKDPNQLQMLMTGTELKGSITDSNDRDSVRGETMDRMWERKTDESKQPKDTGHGAGIHESIDTQGFRPELNVGITDDPGYHGAVDLVHESTYRNGLSKNQQKTNTKVYDGHHKIAAAADIETSSPQRNVWFNVNHRDHGGRYQTELHKETVRSISHNKVDPLPAKRPAPNPELDRAISSLMKKIG